MYVYTLCIYMYVYTLCIYMYVYTLYIYVYTHTMYIVKCGIGLTPIWQGEGGKKKARISAKTHVDNEA